MTGDERTEDDRGDSASTRTGWSSTEELITELTDAVAEETGQPVSALPPLYNAVEMEALQTILTGNKADTVQLSFTYSGTRVRIDSDGFLYVQQRTGDA